MRPTARAIDHAFSALAHPVRRDIVERLRERDLTVGEIARPYGLKNPTISRHLKVLKRAKLVQRTIEGRSHRCRLNPAGIAELQRWLVRYEQFWTGRLDALQQFVDNHPHKERS